MGLISDFGSESSRDKAGDNSVNLLLGDEDQDKKSQIRPFDQEEFESITPVRKQLHLHSVPSNIKHEKADSIFPPIKGDSSKKRSKERNDSTEYNINHMSDDAQILESRFVSSFKQMTSDGKRKVVQILQECSTSWRIEY